MSDGEAGIIAGPPRRPGFIAWALVEGAWLLLALSLTVFLAAGLGAAPAPWSKTATGAALFALHALVGLHVVRTERSRFAEWFRVTPSALRWGVLGGAGLLGFNVLYSLALDRLGVVPPDVMELLREALPAALLYLWAAALAPVVEEMYFRGRLLAALDARFGGTIAAGVTSVGFAAIHGIPEFFPALLVFGLVLLALRRKTGGLIAPIIAHAINNLVALF